MRKADELAMFARIRALHGSAPFGMTARTGLPVWPDLVADLGIHEKRCFYLLEKWAGAGWWDYGVNPRWGWFTPEAPQELKQ